MRAGHLLVELARVEAPLLARVAAEEQLVELAADGVDDHVLGRRDVVDRLGARGEIVGRLLVGLEIEAEQLVERRAVDRDRHQLPAHQGPHAMLVRPPLGELRQIVHDLLAVGVEDVRAVFVVEDAGLVGLVIGVAADVRAPVDQQHARAVLARQALGKNGAGKPGSDDQIIVAAPVRRLEAARSFRRHQHRRRVRSGRVPSTSAIEPGHARLGRVPARRRQHQVGLGQPAALRMTRQLERLLAGGDEFFRQSRRS